MSALPLAMVLVVSVGTAAADPSAPAPPSPAPPPASAPLVLSPLFFEPPAAKPVPSLRLEAARVAHEQFETSWRYPDPSSLVLYDGGDWFIGAGHYRPRSRRAAALHGGSIAATLLGEILLSADSPVAGVGALLTGATLDAAAADADRDAESRR